MLKTKKWHALLLICFDKNRCVEFVTEELRAEFCTDFQNKECTCFACQNIMKKTGQNFLWLTTSSNYDLTSANEILQVTSLQNSSKKSFFIVVEQIEKMPRASANRILKTLEEPPPGYKFIFTTQNASAVLETIKSRCFSLRLSSENKRLVLGEIATFLFNEPTEHMLESLFLLVEKLEPDQAMVELEFENLREAATQEFLLTHKDSSRRQFLEKLLAVANNFVVDSVAPGGGKLFWKAFIAQLIL